MMMKPRVTRTSGRGLCVSPHAATRGFSTTRLRRLDLSVKLSVQIGGKTVDWDQPTGLLINNEFVKGSGESLSTMNPYTAEEICKVHAASSDDVDKAVQAAREALKNSEWSDPNTRSQCFNRLIQNRHNEATTSILAAVESLDNGKSISLSRAWDVPEFFKVFNYYASKTNLDGKTFHLDANRMAYTIKEPVGVVGAIVPWNYPLAMAAWKLAPALACGNTVVLKLSEQTPLSMLYMGSLIQRAFPPGVVNIVNGPGHITGTSLCSHQGINKIAFTGSTKTGKDVMMKASQCLTPVKLETGGKSPLIVCKDADISSAVEAAYEGAMSNQGQVCTATSRIFVHASVYRQFVDAFKSYTEEQTVLGSQFEEDTTQGPQISAEHAAKIESHIETARKAGSKIWQTSKDLPQTGFFVKPTIIEHTSSHDAIMHEEVFGPVATITKFETRDDALKMANATAYGLGAAVFSKNLEEAHGLAKGIEAGMIWINCNQETDCRVPFGGVKQSGFGRDLGEEGLEGYYTTKAVHMRI